jgi:hypothetical protein
MVSVDELHGLKNGVAKLEAELEELRRTLRLTQATNPGSHAASKIIAEIQRCEAIRKGMLHELSLQEPDFWRSFGDRLMGMAREEQGRADVITNGKALRRMEVLRAHCDYKDYRERVFVAEEVRSFYESLGVELTSEDFSKIEAKMLEWTELEKKAGLRAPETGRWTYGTGAVSENFRERVRLCVVEAGRSLPDHPKGTDAENFWLHQLYLDLLKNNSDLLFCGTKEGGMVLSVCVASATFCARLAREAFAHAERGTIAESVGTGSENPTLAVDIDRAIASWKRMHEIDGERLSRHRESAGHSIPTADVELIQHQVWVSFFDEPMLPRLVELEWGAVLSSKKQPDQYVDLGLTLALTKEYARAIGRAVAKVADLLAMASIARQLALTQPVREAIWRECLDFANGLARWDAFATWVEKVTRVQWDAPLTADGHIDQRKLHDAIARRREFFEQRIRMYSSEWLSAADGAIDLRLTASVSKNSPAQNNSKTAQTFESERPGSGVLPATWEQLRKRISIRQVQAAQLLNCDPRTVRRLVKASELRSSSKGRIVCNEQLRNQLRRVHGNHVLP